MSTRRCGGRISKKSKEKIIKGRKEHEGKKTHPGCRKKNRKEKRKTKLTGGHKGENRGKTTPFVMEKSKHFTGVNKGGGPLKKKKSQKMDKRQNRV